MIGFIVQIKKGMHLQLTLRYQTKDVTKNIPLVGVETVWASGGNDESKENLILSKSIRDSISPFISNQAFSKVRLFSRGMCLYFHGHINFSYCS